MRAVFLLFLVAVVSCSVPEYKGEIANITNVPRAIVEREAGLLKERVNLWARQVAQSDYLDNSTRNPYRNDQGMSIRSKVDAGRRVLTMLEEKLRYSGATVDFTRKEWGRAQAVYCTLDKGLGQ